MFRENVPFEQPLPLARGPNVGAIDYKAVGASVLSSRVHWIGRSFFCPKVNCEACKKGWQERMVGFVAAVQRGGMRVTLELPHSAIDAVRRAADRGELLGAIITLEKRTLKSPMSCRVAPADPAEVKNPVDELDLLDQLCRVYALPRRREFMDDCLWQEAIPAKAATLIENAMSASAMS